MAQDDEGRNFGEIVKTHFGEMVKIHSGEIVKIHVTYLICPPILEDGNGPHAV